MKKNFKKIIAGMIAISLCMPVGPLGITAKADGPDPVATLQAAFSAFESSGVVYLDYSAPDGETTVHDQVEIDRGNKIKKIESEDAGTEKTTTSYIDMKAKITYIQKSSSKWEKAPTDSRDLTSVGRILSVNGIEAAIVPGVVYVYEGEEVINVAVPNSEEEAEVDCYRFAAALPIASTDDETDEDEEEYDEEYDEDDEDAEADEGEEEVEVETVNAQIYVAKATGQWVHTETDGEVSLDIAYPAASSLSIPKAAKKSSTLKSGYVVTYKGVKYKVQYKKKKAYLVVSGSTAKAKLNVEKSVKILGKKYNVTEIGNNAFAKNSKLKTLVVKANVTKIGKQAFYNSKKIKSITFKGAGIKSVGKNAFKNVPKTDAIKVPGKKKADYTKKFKKAGFKGKVK